MHRRKRLAALLILLAFAGCAQGIAGQTAAPSTPYLPTKNGNMPEHGGGDGGDGGGGM